LKRVRWNERIRLSGMERDFPNILLNTEYGAE
jgi:hypothetical protein